MKKWIILLLSTLSVLGLLAGTQARAEQNYSAQVVVVDRSETAREQAISEALAKVLKKLTGHPTWSAPQLAGLQSASTAGVAQFRYASCELEAEPQPLMVGASATDATKIATLEHSANLAKKHTGEAIQKAEAKNKKLCLDITFDPHFMTQALIDLDQSVWPKEPPLILVWLGTKSKQGEVLNHQDDPAAQALTQAASDLGLSLMFPVLDLATLRDVTFSDVWDLNLPPIEAASQRYSPQGILIVRINDSDAQWVLEGYFSAGGQVIRWHADPDEFTHILQQAVVNVAEHLRRQYAVPLIQQVTVMDIAVQDVHSVADFELVQRYLQELKPVDQLDIVSVKPGKVIYRLHLSSAAESLMRAIANNKILSPAIEAKEDDQLVYRLVS